MDIRVESDIRPNERSARVAGLHAAMRALGLSVASDELRESRAGRSTARLVREFQRRANIMPHEDYLVDEQTAEAMNRVLVERGVAIAHAAEPEAGVPAVRATLTPLSDRVLGDLPMGRDISGVVRGRITDVNGRVARGYGVVAYDQDLRKQQELGRGRTDASGMYEITYDATRFRLAELGAPDVVVEVYSPNGDRLHATDVLFNAPPRAEVNVQLAGLGSDAEYDRVQRLLTPLLDGQDVSVDALEEDDQHHDITFITGETGLPRDQVLHFAIAHHVQPATKLDAEFWYAVLRQGAMSKLPATNDTDTTVGGEAAAIVAAVPRTPVAAISSALDRAFDANVLAKGLANRRNAWLESYRRLAVEQATGGNGRNGTTKLNDILDAAGVPKRKRNTLVDAYLQGGSRDQIIERVRATGKFDEEQIGHIAATLEINDLTLGNGSLLRRLKPRIDTPTGVRTLAAMTSDDWQKEIAAAGGATPEFVGGNTDEEKRSNYATLLTRRAELAYPTAAFAGGLQRAVTAGKSPFTQAERMLAFFDAHPAFELASTSVDGYIQSSARPRELGAGASRARFVRELKAAQRVFKVAPSFDAANALLTAGVHSAQQVYRMGESKFVRTFKQQPGFTEESAHEAYHRAANTHAAVLTVVSDLRSAETANDVMALRNSAVASNAFPNLANLFGAADVCDCDHCRSIFSPSAYLADVFRFLDGRDSTTAAVSVKDVLFSRRPDLGYVELSCDNSDTPLPYVDLVCEVLEDQVAPWKLFDLALALVANLAEGTVDAAVKTAFDAAAAGINPPLTLSASARVSAQDATNSWVIHDTAATYRVHQAAAALEVSVLRQTRWSAEELAANPEYVNYDAYDVLRAAKYPLPLPFDLPNEEIRAYLANVGVRRAEVMELFRGPNAPNDPTDENIAAERLGVGDYEHDLIFVADPANQFTYWHEADNPSAIAQMSRVDVFLTRTGIEYTDLLRLLSLRWVNPGNVIVVQHLDSSCDTNEKRLQVLDADALDRIHRFLRLWRKLGWKMWEVDLAIRHPALGNGSLDDAFAVRLSAFIQLKERVAGVAIDQLAAFFDDIDTTPKFTAAFAKPEPSLYERLFLNHRLTDPVDDAFTIAAVTAAVPAETIANHLPPILAATRVSDADLAILLGLTQPGNGPAYIDGALSLDNLSFLYRHALLARQLRIKPADWRTLLYLAQVDPFQDPAATLDFVRLVDRIKASGLTIDQLAYILAADRGAKAAEAERKITATLTTLRTGLQAISATTDPASAPNTVDALSGALSAQLQTLGWDAAATQSLVDVFSDRIALRSVAATVPAGFAFPAGLLGNRAISYDGATHAISFIGVMTDAERTTLLNDLSLAAITGDPSYQAAVSELYDTPRLLIKWYRPRFRAPLDELPAGIDFTNQLSRALAAKISYDTERGDLVFAGIMSTDERSALQALSADATYVNAVGALFNRARGAAPADEAWLAIGDLTLPLADETNQLANLLEAEQRMLAYLRHTLSRDAVVQQFAAALRITPAITERLLTTINLFGAPATHPLIDDYTDALFVGSSAAVTYAPPYDNLIDGYYWLHRVALIVRTLKLTFAELAWLIERQVQTGVLDFDVLPVKYDATIPAVAPLAAAIELAEFAQLQHAYRTEDLSLFDVVERLIADAGYANDLFATDVEQLTDWPAVDVERLTDPGVIDAQYPVDYRRVGTWRDLRKSVLMLQRLNFGAESIRAIAGPTVDAAAAAALKQTLRAATDEAQWLSKSQTIQGALRERKRDSLVAFLLSQPMPADAPTGKWENANDLYAYSLTDVQMGACQPTSRIVHAAGTAQLFVQRCFMGLEPSVRVSVETDDAWAQWAWMEQYRLWEANYRVYAFPEDYAEPELRRDKSEIFRALENELRQKEVNRDNVETAFLHYVEQLDEVAQLEVAGTYYQENTHTLHVFGRTPGAEPHTYYNRQFIDGRRWTAWSKVDCDIKGDYLVPLVANERLHLVWPEFRESSSMPTTVDVPQANSTVNVAPTNKQIDVYLATTELRNAKWTPKRVSKDPISSGVYADGTFDRSQFLILPLDFTSLPKGPYALLVGRDSNPPFEVFLLEGCRGYPERMSSVRTLLRPLLTRFQRDDMRYLRNVEEQSGDPLVPINSLDLRSEILGLTPGAFNISYPQYLSYFDRLVFSLLLGGHPFDAPGAPTYLFPPTNKRIAPVTLGTFYDWFYADSTRTFFIRPELVSARDGSTLFYSDFVAVIKTIVDLIAAGQQLQALQALTDFLAGQWGFRLRFRPFYHPLTCRFARELYTKGVDGLMARETQFADAGLDFGQVYSPTTVVDNRFYPNETVDFDGDGSYSLYNWELFFHAPLMIASRLSQNQRFEDATRWFQFIFDPTGGHDSDPLTGNPATAPQKYWITKPFYQRQSSEYLTQRIENLMQLLANDPAQPTPPDVLQELERQVKDWRQNPFDPHLVAQFRTVAYQKMTVIKYVQNLIAWGDQRFRVHTMESVNEATQLYVLAAEILGPRPRTVPPAARAPALTFNELEPKLDALSNAVVEFENNIPVMPSGNGTGATLPPLPNLLYFCIPQNDALLACWSTVEDRLSKIRHCLDIEGVFNPPALFAPAIDPAALVRAMAAGADIGTALADLDAPLPFYRFTTMVQKANEFTNDVKTLGGALLAALEKRDAEELARLRQSQEVALLAVVREVKQKQVDDAGLAVEGLQKNKEMVTIRRDFYAGRDFMNPGETVAMALSAASTALDAGIAIGYTLSGGLKLIPQFLLGAAGFGGSPTAEAETGGKSFGDSSEDFVKTLQSIATALDKGAAISSTVAGYERRRDDWHLQTDLANKELEQLDKQIASATAKQDIAVKELANHDLQIDNAKAVDDFMRDKYTNQELYDWMIGQVSTTYFQSYQLAYDLAKRAERCFRYELGSEDGSYIQFGYWDSLRSGLQAGERLQLDLRRLEAAYLDRNRREFECTKHVSLALLDPQALLTLKDEGACVVSLPEELFDLDYPGHYFRRLKSVSISIPCVAGPHTTVSCTLRLLRNMVRVASAPGAQYEHNQDNGVFTDDDRFRESHVRVNAIATSSAQNDSGVFELNFRDERYLPYEGAGAISTWQIELVRDRELRQFSYETISDVILHVRYTAREDAGDFRTSATAHLKDVVAAAGTLMPLRRLFDVKHEFPTEWYAFLHPTGGAQKELQLTITKDRFPYFAQKSDIQLESVSVFVRSDTVDPLVARFGNPFAVAAMPPATTLDIALGVTTDPDMFHTGKSGDGLGILLDETQPWSLQLRKQGGTFNGITDSELAECYIVVEYTLQ